MNPLKPLAYRFINALVAAPSVRELLYRGAQDIFSQANPATLRGAVLHDVPQVYRTANVLPTQASQSQPVFITARFRSGSTFLWQLFRNMEDITCYYEPLNERRWFLPSSGHHVDNTHLGVDDYRSEYAGMADLDQWFNPEWPFRYLYMDATHHDPRLDRYINELIDRAKGRAVLQFNRVDFRLPWLRAHFPRALIVHLYRHPREQWMSIVGKSGAIGLDANYAPGQLSGDNNFYTLEWARDLRHVFHFLEPAGRHPYEVYYLLWRLSYSYGKSFSDISIGYEDLVTNFDRVAGELVDRLKISNANIESLRKLNQGKLKSRWREYAPEDWFARIEERCDCEIELFFSAITAPLHTS